MIAGRIIETRSSLGASWRRDHRDAIIETGVVWARSGMADGGVPGIEDLSRLGRWLDENGVARDQERPPRAALIAGGRSNLTYLLDAGLPPGSAGKALLVLRRPPLGHVLPTAHDMAREYRVLSALHGTDIPVPRLVAFCLDPAVIGAPFYVMEHVTGLVLRTRDDGAQVTPAQAHQLSLMFADMLAAIHGLDPGAVGLADFGRPEGYLERQLARWQRQWELSQTREMPGYEQLTARLAAGLPAADERGGTLVHGDYRLDNMLVALDSTPRIAAVLDWEMSTLGDPLADLGLALVYWAEAGDDESTELSVSAAVTSCPGFLNRAEIAGRYAALTGRDVSRIGYYMAFGCFKLAVVLEGIHARFLQHKTVGEGFEREGPAVPLLIQRAHRLLDSAE
jgi:aminoglycoside phosphotransferase (APT) family kinase protein